MNPDDFPTPDVEPAGISPETLKRRIDDGETVSILDARSESDFEEWHVEAENVTIENVPYFHFLDDDLNEGLLAQVPDGDPLVVLCAKGGSSEFVAGTLAAQGRDVVHLEGGMAEWARIYERHEVSGYDGPGAVYQYERPSSGCLGYLIADGDEAAVVDPLREFTDRYLADAEELGVTLRYAFDTHVHADHVSGVRSLDESGVTGVVPESTASRGVTYIDDLETAAHGDVYRVGDIEIEAVHTPGHTTGMTSYLVGESLLATGDGLFVESVARPDLEEGDDGAVEAARQLYRSLQERVLALDGDVLVAGGHVSDAAEPSDDGTYTASIGTLVAEMDALTVDEDQFVDVVLADMPPRPANYEDIIATNLGRRDLDDGEAFELELGPNNCAASKDALTGD